MFKNYFKTALRNFWHNKVFSLINVLGLSIGISASLVIYLLVNYHSTFDKFEKDGDRIYRVVSWFSFSGEVYRNSGITMPMGPAVKKELTGFDAVVPFRTADEIKVSIPAQGKEPVIFKHEKHFVFADENYLNLIGYQWIVGSPKTSLQKPYQIVLSQKVADLYFPKLSAGQIIGKQIDINDTVHVTITGIVKDIKQNTDFTFTTFISKATLETASLKPDESEDWNSTNSASQLLVKLSAGTPVSKIEKGMYSVYDKYRHKDPDDKGKAKFILQPLNDIHFNSEYGGYDLPLADKPTLYGLLAVAIFLLLLGCINFINLTTAHASQRAKEIGIRKTLGSSKKQLIFQFLSETFLLTFIATVISIFLTPLILKAFAGFIPEGLHFSLITHPDIIVFLLILIIVVTVLSGFYPAMILSGYKPVLVLKNQAFTNTGKTRNAWLRKSLTISQFVIAQVFIMATILVGKQITYSLNKDMGFKKDAIVYLNMNYYDTVQSHKYVLMDKLKSIPGIAMMSLSNNPPSSNSTWSNIIKYKDGKKETEIDVQIKTVDTNYIKLYHIKLLAGANVTQSDTTNQFLINETYAHILGFQKLQNAIGKYLFWNNNIPVIITGVVADFNQHSLHDPVKPLVIGNGSARSRTINIALMPQNAEGTLWKSTIASVGTAWKQLFPDDDFEYKFFDEDIAKYYDDEQHISSLLMWATCLAVFISCLGLLGFVIYTTNHRTKEIGVRKVLGATVSQIVQIISKEFLLLIVIAFIVAAPLAWFGMNKWLENFAYRTEISWWIFVLGISIMIVIALFTLGFQTIKAAMANPVKSLRSE
ncbi:MAG TPA: FtsX-like permease family protein [Chitinophagaceae bacterium]|nr:FtsX-like permease family protein [Chitinophagaceae bacterium]